MGIVDSRSLIDDSLLIGDCRLVIGDLGTRMAESSNHESSIINQQRIENRRSSNQQ